MKKIPEHLLRDVEGEMRQIEDRVVRRRVRENKIIQRNHHSREFDNGSLNKYEPNYIYKHAE